MTPLERLCLGHGVKPQDWHLQLEKHIPANAVFWIFIQGRLRDGMGRRENPAHGYIEIDTVEAREAAGRFMPLVSKALGRETEIAVEFFGVVVSREKKQEQVEVKPPVKTVAEKPVKVKAVKEKRLTKKELADIADRRFHMRLLQRTTRLRPPPRKPKHVVATNGEHSISIERVHISTVLRNLRKWNAVLQDIFDTARNMPDTQGVAS